MTGQAICHARQIVRARYLLHVMDSPHEAQGSLTCCDNSRSTKIAEVQRPEHTVCYANGAVLMLISNNLDKKSSEVSIKTRSPPTPFSFKGQATKHKTVKWSVNLIALLC